MSKGSIQIVSKNWGFEKIITNNKQYCGKLLYIIKDKQTSLHYHKLKDETFYIQSGKARVQYLDDPDPDRWCAITFGEQYQLLSNLQSVVLNTGDAFHVPPKRIHRIIGLEDTELFEFSTQHFEKDSLRIIKGD